MRRKVISCLIAILIAGVAFVAGMLVERSSLWPTTSRAVSPALISPEDGATLKNGSRTKPTRVEWEFSWSEVPGAEKYQLQIKHPRAESWENPYCEKWVKVGDDWADPKRPAFRYDLDRDGRAKYLGPGGAYLEGDLQGWAWRVRASFGDDKFSKWSEVRTFKVEAPGQ
jgi:hypothetical protein